MRLRVPEKGVPRGGGVAAPRKSSEDAKTSIGFRKMSSDTSEMASPSGMWDGSSETSQLPVSVPEARSQVHTIICTGAAVTKSRRLSRRRDRNAFPSGSGHGQPQTKVLAVLVLPSPLLGL